ncbi:MAG: hypothetical protein ABIJ18_03990 [archaeon]
MSKTFLDYIAESGLDYQTQNAYHQGYSIALAMKEFISAQGPQYRSELISSLRRDKKFNFLFTSDDIKRNLGLVTNLRRVGLNSILLKKAFKLAYDSELKRLGIEKEVLEQLAEVSFELITNKKSQFKVRGDSHIDYLPEQNPADFIRNRLREIRINIVYLL